MVVYKLLFDSSRDLEVKSVTQPLVCVAAVPALGLYFSSRRAEQAGLASQNPTSKWIKCTKEVVLQRETEAQTS